MNRKVSCGSSISHTGQCASKYCVHNLAAQVIRKGIAGGIAPFGSQTLFCCLCIGSENRVQVSSPVQISNDRLLSQR